MSWGRGEAGRGATAGAHGRHSAPRHVLVIGATNVSGDDRPRLRRPGRSTRENRHLGTARRWTPGILKDPQPPHAPRTGRGPRPHRTDHHGFRRADVKALCKEAGMAAVRRYLPVGAIGNAIASP